VARSHHDDPTAETRGQSHVVTISPGQRHAEQVVQPRMNLIQGMSYPENCLSWQVPFGEEHHVAEPLNSTALAESGPALPGAGFGVLGATWCDVELLACGWAAHITRYVVAPPVRVPGAVEDPAAGLLERPTTG